MVRADRRAGLVERRSLTDRGRFQEPTGTKMGGDQRFGPRAQTGVAGALRVEKSDSLGVAYQLDGIGDDRIEGWSAARHSRTP